MLELLQQQFRIRDLLPLGLEISLQISEFIVESDKGGSLGFQLRFSRFVIVLKIALAYSYENNCTRHQRPEASLCRGEFNVPAAESGPAPEPLVPFWTFLELRSPPALPLQQRRYHSRVVLKSATSRNIPNASALTNFTHATPAEQSAPPSVSS